MQQFVKNMVQNQIYQEPNLIAEAYRNYTYTQVPLRIEKHFDFIDLNDEGVFLLGTSNLSGRIWCGSIWVLKEHVVEPEVEHAVSGTEFESSVASGLWLNNKSVIIGCDSGTLQYLTLTKVEERKKHFFITEAMSTEHDDAVVSLDFFKGKHKIVTGSVDMNIKVWDTETLVSEKSYCPAHGHMVTCVKTAMDNPELFLSTSLDGTSLIWDIRQEKPASLISENETGFTSVSWLDENSAALGSNDGNVTLVDLRKKSDFHKYNAANRPIYRITYNNKLSLLSVCADDPFVRVLSYKDKTLTKKYESNSHKDFVRGFIWKHSTDTLYSCGWDSKIISHEFPGGEPAKTNDDGNTVKENDK